MAILRKLIPTLLAVSLIACTENFVPELDVTPVLCVNSLVTAGEPINVKVSKTWIYTDENPDRSEVKDAVVTIYANGQPVGDEYLPKVGDKIRIVADSRTYGEAQAEVTVPHPSPVKVSWRADLKSCSVAEEEMNARVQFDLRIEIEIQDPAAIENYYRYEAAEFMTPLQEDIITDEDGNEIGVEYPFATLYFGTLQYDDEPIFGEHIDAFDTVYGSDSFGFTYFSDRQFEGKSYTLHLNYPDCVYFVSSAIWHPELLTCGLKINLNSISQSLYYWANYLWQQEDGVMGSLGEIGLADPIWGYSNVSSGAGVVAAKSTSEFTLDLGDFLRTLIQR